MKKLKSLLLFLILIWTVTSRLSAQSPEIVVSNQSEIYQKLKGKDNWRLIGKCDSSLIFGKRNGKKNGLLSENAKKI